LSLRASDLRWLPRLAWALGLAAVLRHRTPLPRLIRFLEVSPQPGGEVSAEEEARLVRLVQGVLRRTYRQDFCLVQSLMLYHFLSGWGRDVRLLCGVRRTGEGLAGHAWLEVDGKPYREPADPNRAYHVTFTASPTHRYPYVSA
jgi:hypothetical protein